MLNSAFGVIIIPMGIEWDYLEVSVGIFGFRMIDDSESNDISIENVAVLQLKNAPCYLE